MKKSHLIVPIIIFLFTIVATAKALQLGSLAEHSDDINRLLLYLVGVLFSCLTGSLIFIFIITVKNNNKGIAEIKEEVRRQSVILDDINTKGCAVYKAEKEIAKLKLGGLV